MKLMRGGHGWARQTVRKLFESSLECFICAFYQLQANYSR